MLPRGLFMKHSKNGLIIYYSAVSLCIILWCASVIGIWMAVGIATAINFALADQNWQTVTQKGLRTKIQLAVDAHTNALVRQRIMLVRTDAYGTEIDAAWHKEVARFVDRMVLPSLDRHELARLKNDQQLFNNILDDVLIQPIAREAKRLASQAAVDEKMTAREFETHCARTLQLYGWQATTTTATGDQGADVVAEKHGHRVVIQAKLYNSPVGNKAVQEAHAARSHYRASAAVVVTNSSFTASAQQLAQSTGVHLLHHSELPKLEVMITDTDEAQELSHKLALAGFMPGVSR